MSEALARTSARTHDTVVRSGNTDQGSYVGPSTQSTRETTNVEGGTTLSARAVLDALAASGCEYRAHPERAAWLGRCPLCREPASLLVREARERDDIDDRDPPVQLWCRAGCAHADVLRWARADLVALREEELRRQVWAWRERYAWAIGVARRLAA